jgi:hypothetical protein
MREVNYHKIEGIDSLLSIQVLDEPGAGGACRQQPHPQGDGACDSSSHFWADHNRHID